MHKAQEYLKQAEEKNKEVLALFDKLGDDEPDQEFKESVSTLNKEIEELEHKAADAAERDGIKLRAEERKRLMSASQNPIPFPGAVGADPQQKAGEGRPLGSLGQQFIDSPQYKEMMARVAPQGRISDRSAIHMAPFKTEQSILQAETKTLITGASSTSGGAFIVNERLPIVDPGTFVRPLTFRNLIRNSQTGSDTVEYVRVNSTTNAAAPTAEATSTSDGAKPESAMAWAIVTESVRTIPHWIPITRQALADAPQVRGYVDDYLRYGLEEELEDQMINGTGGTNFTGLDNIAGTTAQAFDTDRLITSRKARTKVRLTGRATPTAYLMHPTDWETIDLLKDNENRYFFGGPSVLGNPRLWGLPVVECEACPVGTGWVADWNLAVIWDRMDSQILVTDSHSDFFIRNIVVILAEMRAAFGVLRPAAFVEIAWA